MFPLWSDGAVSRSIRPLGSVIWMGEAARVGHDGKARARQLTPCRDRFIRTGEKKDLPMRAVFICVLGVVICAPKALEDRSQLS